MLCGPISEIHAVFPDVDVRHTLHGAFTNTLSGTKLNTPAQPRPAGVEVADIPRDKRARVSGGRGDNP